MKTLNGSFAFRSRKYFRDGQSSHWLRSTHPDLSPHYESRLLRNFSLTYATHLSYHQVETLLSHRMGNDKLSDQHIYHLVESYAQEVQLAQAELIKEYESAPCKLSATLVDIYDAHSEEIIFLSDGVCVNEQKTQRDKIAKQGKERTTTDIMMLQTDPHKKDVFKTIIAAQDIDAIGLVQAEIRKTYGANTRYLRIVCISDGATSIKNQNKTLFGDQVCHILDWYHIQAKVIQLMSQIATNKTSKEEYVQLITHYLWHGKTVNAVLVLKFMLTKNTTKRDELVKYLEKNEPHIIDYQRRKDAGKIVGSGRTEKQNDIIVSKRQKRKGMAWSKNGSRNLAIVAAYHAQAA